MSFTIRGNEKKENISYLIGGKASLLNGWEGVVIQISVPTSHLHSMSIQPTLWTTFGITTTVDDYKRLWLSILSLAEDNLGFVETFEGLKLCP